MAPEWRISSSLESNPNFILNLVTTLFSYNQRILCLGAISRKATPVPIPNTVVKLPRADGSAIARE